MEKKTFDVTELGLFFSVKAPEVVKDTLDRVGEVFFDIQQANHKNYADIFLLVSLEFSMNR